MAAWIYTIHVGHLFWLQNGEFRRSFAEWFSCMHRALRKRSGNDEPPRHFIARLHYCHAYEDKMQKVMSIRDLMYQGQRIQIFRDLPPEVVRRRAAFTPARKILRDKPKVRFGLLYPAKLRVTHNGSERLFTPSRRSAPIRNLPFWVIRVRWWWDYNNGPDMCKSHSLRWTESEDSNRWPERHLPAFCLHLKLQLMLLGLVCYKINLSYFGLIHQDI